MERQGGGSRRVLLVVGIGALAALIAVGVIVFGGGASRAQAPANLDVLTPAVSVRVDAAAGFERAQSGQGLRVGDTLRTDASGLGAITYFDGSLTRVGPGTTYTLERLEQPRGGREIVGRLDVGKTFHRVQKVSGSSSRFEVNTSHAVAAVRGTAFAHECETRDRCRLGVTEGSVEVTSDTGEKQVVEQGQQVTIEPDGQISDVQLISDRAWIEQNEQLDARAAGNTPATAEPDAGDVADGGSTRTGEDGDADEASDPQAAPTTRRPTTTAAPAASTTAAGAAAGSPVSQSAPSDTTPPPSATTTTQTTSATTTTTTAPTTTTTRGCGHEPGDTCDTTTSTSRPPTSTTATTAPPTTSAPPPQSSGGSGGGGSAPQPTTTTTAATTTTSTSTSTTTTTPVPNLTIAMDHTGAFQQGRDGRYVITVHNAGNQATTSPVQVVDTPPSGLTPKALDGDGWTCKFAELTCSRLDALAAGSAYPPIFFDVQVAPDAPEVVTNTARVSGGGESNTSDSVVNHATPITPGADLSIAVTRTETTNYFQGQDGATYLITVKNVGRGPSFGAISVVNSLIHSRITINDTTPPRDNGASGPDWNCPREPTEEVTTVTCTRAASDALGPGETFPVLTVKVHIDGNAPATLPITAKVTGGSDINAGTESSPGNNQADLNVPVDARPDLIIDETCGPAEAPDPCRSPEKAFPRGGEGRFKVVVRNQGRAPTNDVTSARETGPDPADAPITVVSRIVNADSVTAFAVEGGSTWACDPADPEDPTPESISCTTSGPVPAGEPLPELVFKVMVSESCSTEQVSHSATVSGGFQADTYNDTRPNNAPVTDAVAEVDETTSCTSEESVKPASVGGPDGPGAPGGTTAGSPPPNQASAPMMPSAGWLWIAGAIALAVGLWKISPGQWTG